MLFLGEIVLNCCTFFYIPCKYLCRILLSEIIITVFMLCFKGKNVKLSPFFNDSSSQDIDNLSAKSLWKEHIFKYLFNTEDYYIYMFTSWLYWWGLNLRRNKKMPLHTFLLSQQTSLVYRSFTKLQGDSKWRAWQHLMLQQMIKNLGSP